MNEAEFDFEIIRLIGHGAYGEVYLARDRNGTYCAVKVIFRESFDHDRPFEREYEGLRKFEIVSRSYDTQVQVLHIGQRENPKQFYYIMELADDQESGQDINPETYVPKTLATELKRRGRLPVKECLSLAVTLARALENLHENGLIHRDIKPGNIIFVKDRPKLADIGLVTDAAVSVSHVGTEGYMPPEGPGSPQADIYSLGKVLYEISTGRHRLDFPELPTNLQELDDPQGLLELNAIIVKACERDPRKRYQCARELLQDLAWLQRGRSLLRRKGRRRKAATVTKAAALLALLLAIFFGIQLYHRQTGPRRQVGPAAPAPARAWEVLFDGRSVEHWRGYRQEGFPDQAWIVEEGALKTVPGGGLVDLVTRDQYDDFELELQWRCGQGANSGIMYHVSEAEAKPYFTGPEMQLIDDEGQEDGKVPQTSAGSLFDLIPPTNKRLKPLGAWNQVRILVRGAHVEHWLNGAKVVEYELGSDTLKVLIARSQFRDQPRYAAFRTGYILLQSYGGETWFRNIRLRRLPALPVTPASASGGVRLITPLCARALSC